MANSSMAWRRSVRIVLVVRIVGLRGAIGARPDVGRGARAEAAQIDGWAVGALEPVVDGDEARLGEAGAQTIEPAFEQEGPAVLLVGLAVAQEQHAAGTGLADQL